MKQGKGIKKIKTVTIASGNIQTVGFVYQGMLHI